MRMKDKVALVTGGGSGIGRATALRLAAEGARVVCADRDMASAEHTAKAIQDAGGTALALDVDVADERSCMRLVAGTVTGLGSLTTLVNSAGVRAGLDALPPPAEWQRVIDINLTGSYYMSRAAMPALRAGGHGSITHLASIYGLVGGSLSPAYAASKGAIVNLTRQMALECAPAVRVNCVCPGVIETPMTAELRADEAWSERTLKKYPLGRFGRPDDIAMAILYLASDDAAFVTGVALPVDGGYTAA
jgi:NAD(P)-dependent dehydrogenase (short-subunit alcohol dehydrogenase family)